jgi:hypothetical protein
MELWKIRKKDSKGFEIGRLILEKKFLLLMIGQNDAGSLWIFESKY